MGAVGRIIGGIVLIGVAILFAPFTPFAIAGWGLTAAGAIFFGTIGASLVLGGISQRLLPKFKVPGRDVSYRAVAAPRVFLVGRAELGGMVALLHTAGTNNEFFYIVLALCEGGGNGIEAWTSLKFGDEEVTFSAHTFNTVHSATGKYAGFVRAQVQDGQDTQTAFSMLTTAIPGLWTANHKGNGVAAIALELKHDPDKMRDFTIERLRVGLKGMKMYDVRTGTTIYSENPAVFLRHYLTAARRALRWTDRDQQQHFPGDKFFEYVERLQNWNGMWGERQASLGSGGGGDPAARDLGAKEWIE